MSAQNFLPNINETHPNLKRTNDTKESKLLISRLNSYLRRVGHEIDYNISDTTTSQIISEVTKILRCPSKIANLLCEKILACSDRHLWDIPYVDAAHLADIFMLENPNTLFITDGTLVCKMPDVRFEKWLKENVEILNITNARRSLT